MKGKAKEKAREIRTYLINNDHVQYFTIETLRLAIKEVTNCSDSRVIKRHIEDMIDFRYIFKVGSKANTYGINLEHEDFDQSDVNQITLEQALKGVTN